LEKKSVELVDVADGENDIGVNEATGIAAMEKRLNIDIDARRRFRDDDEEGCIFLILLFSNKD
jgi:hypothetical protein